jgi:signal transduction histidine kinase
MMTPFSWLSPDALVATIGAGSPAVPFGVSFRPSGPELSQPKRLGRDQESRYHSGKEATLSNQKSTRRRDGSGLERLANLVLEVPDLESLIRMLTDALPAAAGVADATLLLWDRKLETFEELPRGETREAPRARYLISEGQLLETHGDEDGALVPLMARSGLVGMLLLGRRQGARAYGGVEVRHLSVLAARAALAIENHLYQRELIASERMAALGTMAGMLAHDFRGPMTVIRGYAETLLDAEQPPTASQVRERADLIVRMVDRLERMTAETLDFAREGGRVALRNVGLVTALRDLAESLPLEFPGLAVDADLRVDPGAQAALDVDKLRRAVGNIAANALDAMGGQGRLRLEARLNDGQLHLVVGDEGPGIPEAIRDRLFEPFITHGKKGGTGLGLAVTRRFVEDHGGSVELLPDGPGARFRIVIPLRPAM